MYLLCHCQNVKYMCHDCHVFVRLLTVHVQLAVTQANHRAAINWIGKINGE